MKIQDNPDLAIMKNIYCLAAVSILISSFTGCVAVSGSCLSYGHSCWGAHGKRSGGQEVSGSAGRRLDDRWLLARLLARPRARPEFEQPPPLLLLPQSLEEEPDKRRVSMDRVPGDAELSDMLRGENIIPDSETSDSLLNFQRKGLINNNDNQAIKSEFLKILKNVDERRF